METGFFWTSRKKQEKMDQPEVLQNHKVVIFSHQFLPLYVCSCKAHILGALPAVGAENKTTLTGKHLFQDQQSFITNLDKFPQSGSLTANTQLPVF